MFSVYLFDVGVYQQFRRKSNTIYLNADNNVFCVVIRRWGLPTVLSDNIYFLVLGFTNSVVVPRLACPGTEHELFVVRKSTNSFQHMLAFTNHVIGNHV